MSKTLSFAEAMEEMTRRANVPAEDQGHQWHLNGLKAALRKITDEASLEALANPDGSQCEYEVYRAMLGLMGKPVPKVLSTFERDIVNAAQDGTPTQKTVAAIFAGMLLQYSSDGK